MVKIVKQRWKDLDHTRVDSAQRGCFMNLSSTTNLICKNFDFSPEI